MWPSRTRYDPTFWRRLCRMCRHRPRSSCVCQPWLRTPGQRSVQVTLWMRMIEQYYIAATSCPHLAQRPLLLGVLGPVAKLPPSLAVTTSTCCWQPETWTWLLIIFQISYLFIKYFSWNLVFRWGWHKWLLKMTKACQNLPDHRKASQ